jgi:hypothetical protein
MAFLAVLREFAKEINIVSCNLHRLILKSYFEDCEMVFRIGFGQSSDPDIP